MEFDELLKNVVIASFGCVGLIEVLKNFLKTERKWIFSLIMIPLSVVCFFVCVVCPPWVIGGILTVGATQLCYQTIVQTFQGVVKRLAGGKVVSTGSTTASGGLTTAEGGLTTEEDGSTTKEEDKNE